MRMGTVIIPMQGMAMQVPAIQITGIALQAADIQTEAVTWATARSLRTEEPRKAVLTRQMPLHRMVRLEIRCTSSREGMPSTARHRRRAALPETGLPTSRKAWPHSFPLLHSFSESPGYGAYRQQPLPRITKRKELRIQSGYCSSFFAQISMKGIPNENKKNRT